jgi:CDP-4-dehydro-6-deoxyglucose reductase
LQNLSSFDFIPGQFVTLDLPIHEKSNKRWRSYSIASWPDGSNIFELVIVLNQRRCRNAVPFPSVKVGSELVFRGPQGVFTLPRHWIKIFSWSAPAPALHLSGACCTI